MTGYTRRHYIIYIGKTQGENAEKMRENNRMRKRNKESCANITKNTYTRINLDRKNAGSLINIDFQQSFNQSE